MSVVFIISRKPITINAPMKVRRDSQWLEYWKKRHVSRAIIYLPPPAWAKPNWLIMELLCCRKSGSLFLVLIQFQWSLSLADSFSKPLTFLSLKYTVFYFSGVIHISWIFWIHLLKDSFRFSYWFVQWGFTAVGGDESFYVLWVSHRIIHSSIRWVKQKKNIWFTETRV